MEIEHCIREDGEEIRNFLYRIKRTIDKGWPVNMNGFEAAQQNAEPDAQARQKKDNDTSTTHYKDSDLGTYNGKQKNI